MNDENLKNGKKTQFKSGEEAAKRSSEAGKKSGKVRREKANMRKACQDLMNGTYKDEKGKELTGTQMMAITLFRMAVSPKDKNCLQAIRMILDLTGQGRTKEEEKRQKLEVKFLQARLKEITGESNEIEDLGFLADLLNGK